jgi:phage repressor protein C with HTH and peptisase S24 domain
MRIAIDNIFYHTIPPSATESATFAFSFFCRLDLSVRNRYAESENKRKAETRMLWDSIPVPKGTDADFAVAVTDDSLAPWIKKGGTVYLRRRTELYDGDIGLFETDGGIVFRQFCADSRGTVYLFAVNRAHAEDDRMIPPDKAAELVCYGRLELKKPIPLPMD